MPDSFYYFCALNSERRQTWLKEILLENKIYFRSREQLNDPDELRPKIIFDGTDHQIRQFVRQAILTHLPNKLAPAKRLIEENKLIHKYRNKTDWVEKTLHQLLDKVGLFCLSESPNHPLMWSHYADGARGACIEFDANLGMFLAAQQVHYSDQEPVINRLTDSHDEILKKSMFIKGTHWAYEQEWRIVARWHDEDRIERYFSQHHIPEQLASFMRDQHGPGYYSFPPEAIRCIILGPSMKPDMETWLRSVLGNRPMPTKIKCMKSTRNGQIEDCD